MLDIELYFTAVLAIFLKVDASLIARSDNIFLSIIILLLAKPLISFE